MRLALRKRQVESGREVLQGVLGQQLLYRGPLSVVLLQAQVDHLLEVGRVVLVADRLVPNHSIKPLSTFLG